MQLVALLAIGTLIVSSRGGFGVTNGTVCNASTSAVIIARRAVYCGLSQFDRAGVARGGCVLEDMRGGIWAMRTTGSCVDQTCGYVCITYDGNANLNSFNVTSIAVSAVDGPVTVPASPAGSTCAIVGVNVSASGHCSVTPTTAGDWQLFASAKGAQCTAACVTPPSWVTATGAGVVYDFPSFPGQFTSVSADLCALTTAGDDSRDSGCFLSVDSGVWKASVGDNRQQQCKFTCLSWAGAAEGDFYVSQGDFDCSPQPQRIAAQSGAAFCALTRVDDDSDAAFCSVFFANATWWIQTGPCQEQGCAYSCFHVLSTPTMPTVVVTSQILSDHSMKDVLPEEFVIAQGFSCDLTSTTVLSTTTSPDSLCSLGYVDDNDQQGYCSIKHSSTAWTYDNGNGCSISKRCGFSCLVFPEWVDMQVTAYDVSFTNSVSPISVGVRATMCYLSKVDDNKGVAECEVYSTAGSWFARTGSTAGNACAYTCFVASRINTHTVTPTPSPTVTGTATSTPTHSSSRTRTETTTDTRSPSTTDSATPSTRSTLSNAVTASAIATPSPILTITGTSSGTRSAMSTLTSRVTASNTDTLKITDTPAKTMSSSATSTLTETETVTLSSSPTSSPSVTRTGGATFTGGRLLRGTDSETESPTATPSRTAQSIRGILTPAGSRFGGASIQSEPAPFPQWAMIVIGIVGIALIVFIIVLTLCLCERRRGRRVGAGKIEMASPVSLDDALANPSAQDRERDLVDSPVHGENVVAEPRTPQDRVPLLPPPGTVVSPNEWVSQPVSVAHLQMQTALIGHYMQQYKEEILQEITHRFEAHSAKDRHGHDESVSSNAQDAPPHSSLGPARGHDHASCGLPTELQVGGNVDQEHEQAPPAPPIELLVEGVAVPARAPTPDSIRSPALPPRPPSAVTRNAAVSPFPRHLDESLHSPMIHSSPAESRKRGDFDFMTMFDGLQQRIKDQIISQREGLEFVTGVLREFEDSSCSLGESLRDRVADEFFRSPVANVQSPMSCSQLSSSPPEASPARAVGTSASRLNSCIGRSHSMMHTIESPKTPSGMGSTHHNSKGDDNSQLSNFTHRSQQYMWSTSTTPVPVLGDFGHTLADHPEGLAGV